MTWQGFQKDEAAQWGKAIADAHEGFQAKVTAINEAAARGFFALPGDAAEALQVINAKIQAKINEANAKIYEIESMRSLQEEELTLNLDLAMLKADLDLYKSTQQNLYELEEATAEHGIQMSKTDIEFLLSEIEANQVRLIQMKADLEFDLSGYRLRVVNAELVTLAVEQQLSQEKYATAQEKLKIIDELYKLIDAEQLVVVAEQQKMVALDKVIVAETAVAAIKKAMVPLYLDKAAAKEFLAAAITEDAKVQRDILLLGYDKIAMKDAEQAADETLRQAEIVWETAHEEFIKASLATELARINARIALMQHSTDIKESVLGYDLEAAKKRIDLRIGKEVWNSGIEAGYNLSERTSAVGETAKYAASHAIELLNRAQRKITRRSGHVEHQAITKG